MKLLFGIKRLEDMAGGAERVILQIIDGLKNDYGHDITLISFDRPEAESFYTLSDGIEWIRLGIGDSAKPANFSETLKRILSLRKVVQKSECDVLIGFQHSFFVPLIVSALGLHKKIIASEHIVPDHYSSRRFEYFLLIITGLFCKKITVLSETILKMYPSFLLNRMCAIPNPVVLSGTLADTQGGMRKTLLTVGRLEKQKDHRTLILAFSKIAQNFTDWDLKIIGEGSLRRDIEHQIESLGLQKRIYLCGLKKDIEREYQEAQAFVLASLYESFGLATAEAMSAGLPVIGFADCPGTNELIQNNINGILVSQYDMHDRAESLAQALKKLMSDPLLRRKLGDGGRKTVAHFSSEQVVKVWDDLIRSVIAMK